MPAQQFVQELFSLVGRPFKDKKHLEPAVQQTHLGLLNDFTQFRKGELSTRPKEGQLEEKLKKLCEIQFRKSGRASLAEIIHVTGTLVFLLMSCFDKIGRGGLQPFYSWITDHVDVSTLWRTKRLEKHIYPSRRIGLEFFIRAIPMIAPKVYR